MSRQVWRLSRLMSIVFHLAHDLPLVCAGMRKNMKKDAPRDVLFAVRYGLHEHQLHQQHVYGGAR